jgi:hypothetical protein
MPNRRAHDHIGNIRQKLGIRIGLDAATQAIKNLKTLADANITIGDIDKIVTKIVNDPKFLTQFLNNYKSAIKTLGINLKL